LLLILTLVLNACNPGGTSTPTPNACQLQPSGEIVCTLPFSQPVSKYRAKAPGPGQIACPPGSFDMVNQKVEGTANAVLHPVNLWLTATVNVPDGLYHGSLAFLTPTCGQVLTTDAFHANFGLTYVSEVDYSIPPACVYRSRVDFTSFVMTGFNLVDKEILQVVLHYMQDQILKSIDFIVADAVNQSLLGTGTPLPANTDPRCPNWQPLP